MPDGDSMILLQSEAWSFPDDKKNDVQVEAGFPLQLWRSRPLDLVASRYHVPNFGGPVRPLLELLKRPHRAGLFIYPRHEVERVAHPCLYFRPCAFIVERLSGKIRTIEDGLEIQERGATPLGNKS